MISTLSGKGIRSIAPYSCIMPILRPLDLITLASARKRDTLNNIRETQDFVVNLIGADLAGAVMPTARFSPPDGGEFELAGLTEKPSVCIRSPGILGSYAWAWVECSLFKIYEEADYILVVGKVSRLEVADEVLSPEGDLDVKKARSLMMRGNAKGMRFATMTDIDHFEPFSAMFPEGKDPVGN